MYSLRDENRVKRGEFLPAFSSFSAREFHGDGFLPPATFRLDKLASAGCGNGRRRAFGRTSLRSCLRNFKQLTRSIGTALSWIAPRCAHLAEAIKPAQIPRIGAKSEASTM